MITLNSHESRSEMTPDQHREHHRYLQQLIAEIEYAYLEKIDHLRAAARYHLAKSKENRSRTFVPAEKTAIDRAESFVHVASVLPEIQQNSLADHIAKVFQRYRRAMKASEIAKVLCEIEMPEKLADLQTFRNTVYTVMDRNPKRFEKARERGFWNLK